MTVYNGILIAASIIAGISVLINVFLIWYTYYAVKQINNDQHQINDLIEELKELQEIVGTYVNHLESVEELEMFYGDETLRDLMRHGRAVTDAFTEYRDLYFPILNKEENINDNDPSENPEKEIQTNNKEE